MNTTRTETCTAPACEEEFSMVSRASDEYIVSARQLDDGEDDGWGPMGLAPGKWEARTVEWEVTIMRVPVVQE